MARVEPAFMGRVAQKRHARRCICDALAECLQEQAANPDVPWVAELRGFDQDLVDAEVERILGMLRRAS